MQTPIGAVVYILESARSPGRFYTGLTHDFPSRMKEHMRGAVPTTAALRPLYPTVVVWFEDERKAAEFERYLKSGSGRAFAKRHF